MSSVSLKINELHIGTITFMSDVNNNGIYLTISNTTTDEIHAQYLNVCLYGTIQDGVCSLSQKEF